MTSGWTRWVFEQFGFDHQLVFPPDFENGGLNAKFDVIVLPSGAIPGAVREGGGGGPGGGGELQSNDQTIPPEWRARMGSMNAKAIAELKTFAENGGHIIAIGDSAQNLLRPFGLPLESALTEPGPDGTLRRMPNTKFFVPGSVLKMKLLDSDLTGGLTDYVDCMFDNSPAFRWTTPTPPRGATVAVFDTDKPLRSGWAWGQEVLKDTIAAADVPLGKGRVVLFGPEVLFRGQPTQTFKLVFNAILRSGAK